MALSIDNLRMNLSQPAQTFTWNVKIANLPGGVGDMETLMLRCQSTKIPARRVSVIQIPYKQGPKLQYPGKLEYDHTWDCTFIEGEDNAVMNAFYAWSQAQVDDVSNLGAPEGAIKTDIYLSLTSRANDAEYRQIRLKGCFVKSINEVALDYNGEDVIKLGITFCFDTWEITV